MRAGQRAGFETGLFVDMGQEGADRTFAVGAAHHDDGAFRLQCHPPAHFADAFQTHVDYAVAVCRFQMGKPFAKRFHLFAFCLLFDIGSRLKTCFCVARRLSDGLNSLAGGFGQFGTHLPDNRFVIGLPENRRSCYEGIRSGSRHFGNIADFDAAVHLQSNPPARSRLIFAQ